MYSMSQCTKQSISCLDKGDHIDEDSDDWTES
jgi:hypothetical protein